MNICTNCKYCETGIDHWGAERIDWDISFGKTSLYRLYWCNSPNTYIKPIQSPLDGSFSKGHKAYCKNINDGNCQYYEEENEKKIVLVPKYK